MKYDPTKKVQVVWFCGLNLTLGGWMWDDVDRILILIFPLGFAGLMIRCNPKKRKDGA